MRVVIDAGHGGSDPGAVSKDRATYEKTLTLDISKRLAKLISESFPEVTVTMTRTSDRFVSLNDRAINANKADADLFISIHINSSAKTSPNGYSVHVLGQSSNRNRDLFAYNMDVCRRENSVILLEDDYSTKYQGFDPSDTESLIFMQLMQNAHLEQSLLFAQIVSEHLRNGPIRADRGVWQNPFYVLWKTAMPSVLVELGFISNSSDLAKLRSEDSRQKLSQALFDSFSEYKESYDGSVRVNQRVSGTEKKPAAAETKPAPAETKPDIPAAPETVKGERVLYGTQIFAVKSRIPEGDSRLLGYKPEIVQVGDLYKYVIGISTSEQEARSTGKKIKEKYPYSFTVKITNGVLSSPGAAGNAK